MHLVRFSLAVVAVFACWALYAAPKKARPEYKAYTNPLETDADFPFQGEYVGNVEVADGKYAAGTQIVALGDGKFQGVAYLGGLPGAGWDRQTKYEGEGQREDNTVVFKHLLGSGKLVGGVLSYYEPGESEVAKLKKTERHSPTEGQKPPEGAVVLFDGTSADAFEDGKMEDGLLLPGCVSKQRFGDFALHLEFRVPYMPTARGQARGNSGCYLQGRYELQILDSFGLVSQDNDCGGIYKIRPPGINACYPPLSWQTYDIDFTAAEYDDSGKQTKEAVVSVRQNGETIHKDLRLPAPTPGGKMKPGPEPGPLYLQDHHNPVRFRNIWVVEKKTPAS